MRAFFLLWVLLTALTSTASAQVLDPYKRLNDPVAICDLSGCDTAVSSSLVYVARSGSVDPDGYFVIKEYHGSGILRHFWDTYDWGHAAPTDSLKLYIDDSLILNDQAESFFHHQGGLIRTPFDTAIAGGQICDGQLPFKKSFKITFSGSYLFRATVWQPLPYDSVPDALHKNRDFVDSLRRRAEQQYWSNDPWPSSDKELEHHATLTSGSKMEIAQLDGPGLIEKLHIVPSYYDVQQLQQIVLIMRWDNRPEANVEVPLSDFFGVSSGMRDIKSIRIRSSSKTGFECTFPMPFRDHAEIYLENRSDRSLDLSTRIAYSLQAIPKALGYFSAQFHNSSPIRRKQYHEVIHAKGRGRFVGEFLMLPDHPEPSFLEGDPVLMVDSISEQTNHYIGTEDYFNAGWYFLDSAFSLPFCGCPDRWGCMYRFHINDAVNFANSFDFRFGHGAKDDDFRTTYRSVGFYYQEIIPFWTTSDTILSGSTLSVGGMSYQPGEVIHVSLNQQTIYVGNADASGTFHFQLPGTSLPPPGTYTFSINGVRKPEHFTILASPVLSYKQDSSGQVAIWRDSVQLHGYGFKSNEKVKLYLGDSIVFPPAVIADGRGQFAVLVHVPWVDSGFYHFTAMGTGSTAVRSDSTIRITRSLNYEIEDQKMVEGKGYYNYAGWTAPDFGNQQFTFIYADSGNRFSWNFEVPYSDSFRVDLFAAVGDRWGRYRILLDSTDCGVSDWFKDWPWGPVGREQYSLGVHFIAKGLHTLTCVCEGRDSAAVENSFGPDNLLLTSATPFHPLFAPAPASQGIADLVPFPNPVVSTEVNLNLPSTLAHSKGRVQLFDLIGKKIADLFDGKFSESGPLILHIPPIANGVYQLIVAPEQGSARRVQIVVNR